MRLGSSLSKLLAASALVLGASLVVQACAKQSEAERCEVDSDCESGLTCKFDLYCCPPAGQETTTECRQAPTTTVDGGVTDTAPVEDTGALEDAETGLDAAEADAEEVGADTGTDTEAPDTEAPDTTPPPDTADAD